MLAWEGFLAAKSWRGAEARERDDEQRLVELGVYDWFQSLVLTFDFLLLYPPD